jgi:hypothetical protein
MRSLEIRDGHSAGKTADLDELRAEVMLSRNEGVETGLQGVDDGLYTIQHADGVGVIGTGVGGEDLPQSFPVAAIDGKGVERQRLTDRLRRDWVRESLRRELPCYVVEAHRPGRNLGAAVACAI